MGIAKTIKVTNREGGKELEMWVDGDTEIVVTEAEAEQEDNCKTHRVLMIQRVVHMVAAAAACGPVFQMVFLSDHVVNPSSGSLDSAFNGSQRINQAPISCPDDGKCSGLKTDLRKSKQLETVQWPEPRLGIGTSREKHQYFSLAQ
ncbi:hypothetical protein GOBAR_AA10862 [Gossypium barbadense]|uniref:Uncharacterized protein n=1 Tax=Gossypium barbadense TaxID=3634 RepID=A0A2P5Y2K5_GOSBA|nr:hypothetical protein GOBAR_AA10862 [Gossypium barbadense]